MKYVSYVVLFSLFLTSIHCYSQSNLGIQHISDIPMSCGNLPMTMIHDQQARPYLYVANKAGGLTIYDISNINTPNLVFTIPEDSLDFLDVNSITQEGNYLYLALGNFFTGTVENSGMAIVDVTNPTSPLISDQWKFNTPGQGAGFVALEGNYAYLAAMGNGIFVFDVTDKNNIIFQSQFVPDINFPDPNPDPNKYNARGVAVKNDTAYVAYDAGGLRIIDVSNKLNPVQIGQYSNPSLNGLPRAYNNLILDDSLVYVTIDYCGLEVLNISDPSNIALTGWWNPWGCPNNNWFTSIGHTNELSLDKTCNVIFMSTGKSEMYAVDISNPAQPDSLDIFGSTTNNIGTWGVSSYNDKIFLSYICTFGIPFPGTWPGVKILSYNNSCITEVIEKKENIFKIYPNPTQQTLSIENLTQLDIVKYQIINSIGETVISNEINSKVADIDLSQVPAGNYIINLISKHGIESHRFLKN